MNIETFPKYMWTLEQGVDFARGLEGSTLPYGWHVALGGGVLHRGGSMKDLDLIFKPRYGALVPDLYIALKAIGMTQVRTARQMRGGWAEPDPTHVEEWRDHRGRRIDVIIMGQEH